MYEKDNFTNQNDQMIDTNNMQEVNRSEEIQAEKMQPEEIRAEGIQPEEIRAEGIQPEEIRAEEIQSEEIRAEEIQAEEIQPEDMQREAYQPEEHSTEAETAEEVTVGRQPESGSGSGSTPVWSARDIKPRPKSGWGKRIAVLLLCGVLLGSSSAGAYYGVRYLVDGTVQQEQQTVAGESTETTNQEIAKVEDTMTSATAINVDGTTVSYDVSDVVDNVMPAMVSIVNNYTETVDYFFGQSYTQQGASSGSGIIIGQNDTEILIATNYHVVSGSDSIEITFIDGSKANAYIKGTNPQMDLAVVSVTLDSLSTETKDSIAVASIGNSEDLRLGQPVIAIGNALGYGQSVTTGVVSAIDREITMEDGTTGNFIQTDAAINPGNSGGALLNLKGQVIGINSSKIGGSTIEGMGYAIPTSAAEPIISDLSLQETKMKVDEADRGYLGVTIQEVTSTISQMYGMPQGVFIDQIEEGGAADQGGILSRDVIVGFGSFQISSISDLQEAMQYYAAGETVTVTVMRAQGSEYTELELELTLGARKQ